jgi:hypothetical protein
VRRRWKGVREIWEETVDWSRNKVKGRKKKKEVNISFRTILVFKYSHSVARGTVML